MTGGCSRSRLVTSSVDRDWDSGSTRRRRRRRRRAGRCGRGPPVALDAAAERARAAAEEGGGEGEERRGEQGPVEEPGDGDHRERMRTGEDDGHEAEPDGQKRPASRATVRPAGRPA